MTSLPKSIERFFIPVLVFCVFDGANAQKIEEVIDFGDTLFVQHLYNAALNEYLRAFFFSGIEDKSEISHKIADCHLAVHDYRSAISYYDSATYYSKNDSAKIEYALEKILCSIFEKNYGYAIYKLNEIQTGSNEHLLHKKNLYMGISLFGAEQYEEAFSLFYNSIEPDDSVKISRLYLLNDDVKNLSRPFPAVASLMSALVPGTGQMYTGNFYDGINSVLVLYGLVYISIYARIIDFPLILPFLNRYYVGGITNANIQARDKKREKQHNCYIELMKIFQESDTLCSPFEKYPKKENYQFLLKDSVSSELVLFSKLLFFYKTYLSSQDVDACVFTPSCSVYMVNAIEKHGTLKGLLEGFDRLLRCHVLVSRNDYPLDRITKKFIDDN